MEQMNGMTEPLITVIIPNYNNQKYIVQCIQSVQQQTYRNLEILLVDDCSTDQSPTLIQELLSMDERIRLVRQQQNQGVSHTRNVGLKEATGSLVTYLDGDDFYYDREKLKREVQTLLKHKGEAVAVYTKILHVNEQGQILCYQPKGARHQGKILNWLLRCNETGLYPRDYCIYTETLKVIGGYREDMDLFEDYELLLRMAPKISFYLAEGIGTAYRIKDTGLSSQAVSKLERTRYQLFWKYVKHLPWLQRQVCIMVKYSNACYRKIRGTVAAIIGRN